MGYAGTSISSPGRSVSLFTVPPGCGGFGSGNAPNEQFVQGGVCGDGARGAIRTPSLPPCSREMGTARGGS